MEEIARHDVLAGLEQAREALVLARAGTERGYGLSDGESREAVEAAAALVAAAQAVYLQTVKNLDGRVDAVPGAAGGAAARTFLVHRLHVDPGVARGLVEAAHALDGETGDLPLVGEALADGEVTFEHAQVCVKAVGRLPRALKTCMVTDAGCDAHHVVFWSRGGPTDLDNMILLCGHHHQQVHADIWQIKIRDGLPWVRPPAWVDPHRRLRRNPLHDNDSPLHRLAEQLTLALTDTDDQDDDDQDDDVGEAAA